MTTLVCLTAGTKAYASNQSTQEDIDYILSKPFSSKLLNEVNLVIEGLPKNTKTSTRIDLDYWKLQAIPDDDTDMAVSMAQEIYNKYERDDYKSEEQYGRVIHEMVLSKSKLIC